jgi:hypothetical protein
MLDRDEVQARINAMIQQLHDICDGIHKRMDQREQGLTHNEEAEILAIELRIDKLRRSV